MARVLIVGASPHSLDLALQMGAAGHAVRVVVDEKSDGSARAYARARTRAATAKEHTPHARPDGDAGSGQGSGADIEWCRGDPMRLGTLRSAFEQVTVACWLFGSVGGTEAEVSALHGVRLESFVRQIVDSSVRGLVYEASGTASPQALQRGRGIVEELTTGHSIPLAVITADPLDAGAWLAQARAGIAGVLGLDTF
jgi:hypothetical protein